MTFSRRTFLLGAATALAAPAVVRAEGLMKLWVPPVPRIMTPEEMLNLSPALIQPGDFVTWLHDKHKWVVASL